MALIVEDGSVVAGAESYASVAFADSYHAKRDNQAWDAVAEKEACLRKATDFMQQMYRGRWKGYRKDGVQVLDWPRSFVYLEEFVHGAVGTYPYLVSDTIVPVEVQNACCELALRAASGPLAPDLTRAKTATTIGPISVQYDKNSPESPRYRAMDALLSPYLVSSSNSVRLTRT